MASCHVKSDSVMIGNLKYESGFVEVETLCVAVSKCVAKHLNLSLIAKKYNPSNGQLFVCKINHPCTNIDEFWEQCVFTGKQNQLDIEEKRDIYWKVMRSTFCGTYVAYLVSIWDYLESKLGKCIIYKNNKLSLKRDCIALNSIISIADINPRITLIHEKTKDKFKLYDTLAKQLSLCDKKGRKISKAFGLPPIPCAEKIKISHITRQIRNDVLPHNMSVPHWWFGIRIKNLSLMVNVDLTSIAYKSDKFEKNYGYFTLKSKHMDEKNSQLKNKDEEKTDEKESVVTLESKRDMNEMVPVGIFETSMFDIQSQTQLQNPSSGASLNVNKGLLMWTQYHSSQDEATIAAEKYRNYQYFVPSKQKRFVSPPETSSMAYFMRQSRCLKDCKKKIIEECADVCLKLECGHKVKIYDLKNAKAQHYNGQGGIIDHFVSEKNRVAVKLDAAGRVLSVKPQNLSKMFQQVE